MFKRQKHLFIQEKTSYKKFTLICSIFLVLFGAYFFIHIYLNNEINLFIKKQQYLLKEQNLNFLFKPSFTASWRIWPQITVSYPTIQKNISSTPRILWQAKQAKISYSLLHPLSLSIELDGEQLYCINDNSDDCLQTHGSSWSIYIPLIGAYEKSKVSFKIKEVFYTKFSQSLWNIRSLQLKNIQGDLHWNYFVKSDDSLAFSDFRIEQILINFTTLQTQKVNNIQLQAALIANEKAKELSSHSYKLLLQKAAFSWNDLSINSAGKLYISYPQLLPIGEVSLHLKGVNQTIYQQLALLNCCNKLKQELSQTSLPSQLNFTILIREGVIYLGTIPLQKVWYDYFKTMVNNYTK